VSVTDYQTAPTCGYCGEKISISDDNAGQYAMRNEEQMHNRCAELWDGEQVRNVKLPHQIICRDMTCGYCFSMLWDCNCPQNVMCEDCHSEPDDADLTEKCEHSDDGVHHWRGQVGDGTETIQPEAAA
jgi:hypothetical protein